MTSGWAGLNKHLQSRKNSLHKTSVALLATWLTGAHAHRHVVGHEHQQSFHAWSGFDTGHESGHGHELDFAHDTEHDLGSAKHSESEHFNPHSVALSHANGHENVELPTLQPP